MPKVCPVCDTVYTDANAFCPVDGTTLHVVDLEGGLIGSVVADRYLVTDLLGEGGMGKVYLARHVRLPQQAAIKVLRRDMVRDPAAVARFNREASNASRIDDEHVARVYDFGEASDGTVYLAMEYVPGRTLKEVVARDGALEPRRAADLVDQIAKGLDAAHRLKIIHRDLKPDNILVVEGPEGGPVGGDRVKVVDFGIAKAFGADGGNLTKTGFVVGTPEFMSPEQLMGAALDARSDVYALGLVAFQCFTAALPFVGDTPDQVMTGRLTSAPRRLDEVTATSWPTALQDAFDAALSRDVAKRPESAGAFARMVTSAIDAWIPGANGNPPAQRTSSSVAGAGSTVEMEPPFPPSAEFSKTRRWPIVVSSLVVVLTVGTFFTYRLLQPPNVIGQSESAAAVSDQLASPTQGAADATKGTASRPTTVPGGAGGSDQAVARLDALDSADVSVAARPANDSSPRIAAEKASGLPAGAVGRPGADASSRQRDSMSSAGPAPRVATPPPAPAPVVDPTLREELDSLSVAVKRPRVDDVTARRLAGALRGLVARLTDPSLKTRAYFRLIDASMLSGDESGACAAFRGAKAFARSESQLAELRKFEQDLGGCG